MMEGAPATDPLIGAMIGEKYRVVRVLGEGGMGTVYEGEHTLIKRRVAIKVLKSELATSADVIARFHREAMAATHVGNEHIVEVTDMGRLPSGGPFMVLELLVGHDFANVIERQGPLPLARVARIMLQLCDGLAAAHDKGIVHRDLKPENVFLVQRGQEPDFVKILDFGISKVLDASDGEQKSGTRTGTVLGTGYYMAPEQAMGKKDLDHRADVWALGVILFRALTREYPFESDTYAGLLVRVVTDAPRSLRELRPGLGEAAYAVVERCLAKAPADRFADCRALARALEPLAKADVIDVLAATAAGPVAAIVPPRANTEATPATLPLGKAATTPPPADVLPRSTRVQTLALGLVGVAAVIAGAIALRPGTGTQPTETSTTASRSIDASVAPSPDAAAPSEPAPTTLGRATVHVHLSSIPASATMTLDGASLPNPFDDELPRGADMHVLETSAEGFRTDRRDLSLLFPADLTITLQEGRGVSDTRTHRVPPTRAPTGETSDTPSTPPTTSAPPTTTTTPPPTEAAPVPDGVVVPPEQRLLKHLHGHP